MRCTCTILSAHKGFERFFLQQGIETGGKCAPVPMEHVFGDIRFVSQPSGCKPGKSAEGQHQRIFFRTILPELRVSGIQLFRQRQQDRDQGKFGQGRGQRAFFKKLRQIDLGPDGPENLVRTPELQDLLFLLGFGRIFGFCRRGDPESGTKRQCPGSDGPVPE